MKKNILKSVLLIAIFTISCEKNEDINILKSYDSKTIITNEKLIGGIVNSEGLLVTLKAPTFSGFNYNTIPEILFLDSTGIIIKKIQIDTNHVNFKSEAYSGRFQIPIGIKVEFSMNSRGTLFMSNNIDTFIYKVQDNGLIKYANVGPHVSSISFDKNDNLYALREPYFNSEMELYHPPVILKASESGQVQSYFSFPKDSTYYFGTGQFLSWPNSDTWHMKPYPMSLYINNDSEIFITIMVMNTIYKLDQFKNLDVYMESIATADVIEDFNGNMLIIQSHYIENLTSTDHDYTPLKISNYSQNYEIFRKPIDRYNEFSYDNSSKGKLILLDNQLSIQYDHSNQIIYFINSIENEIVRLK